MAVAPEAGWVTEQLSSRSARRAVMVRVLLAVPAAEQFASCLRPSRYQVSTEPGAARGARQVKARLSSSRSVHEASGRPSMVGPGSLSPAGAPRARQSCGGGSQHPGLCQTPPGPHLPGRAPGSRAAAAGRGQPLGSPRGSPWQPAGLGARGEAGGAGPRAHPLAAGRVERLEDATRPPLPAALLLLRPACPAARRLGTQARLWPRASRPQQRL